MTRVDNIVETDGALILGAGIAGLFTALKLAPMPSIVLAGTRPGLSGSSAWAQGGIAASVGEGDSWQSHAHDTMVAGAGLCVPVIVELVAQDVFVCQAEDGIRGIGVTGVQACALPIFFTHPVIIKLHKIIRGFYSFLEQRF